MIARRLLQVLVVLVCGLCLVACSATPQLRNQYSLLQLSEVLQQPGDLQLKVRVSNFGEKEYTVEAVEFTLSIEGQAPIRLQRKLELELPGFGIETLTFQAPGVTLPEAATSLNYVLEGKVSRNRFGGGIPFRHEGRLSPVPGVTGAWR